MDDDFEDDLEDEEPPSPIELTVWVTDDDEEPVFYMVDGTGLSWARPPFGFCSQRSDTMALSLDDFTSASRPSRANCSVRQILEALDAADAGVVEAALADDTVAHVAIAKVLSANGHAVAQGTVGRHRSGACSCVRDSANTE